jgi:hypothetical protein
MPASDSIRFAWLDTPDPKRLGFSITIPDAAIEQVDLAAFEPNVTTWEEMRVVMRGERVRASLRSYVYTLSRQSGGGTRTFYFFPAFTDLQRNTPFRTEPGKYQMTWPAVLERLVFAEDFSLPQLSRRNGIAVELPTIIPQVLFRDAYTHKADCTIREFLSDKPWPRSRTRHRTPIPTSVFWTFQGQQIGSFPECLHPEVNPNLDGYSQFMNPIWGAGTHNGLLPSFDFSFRIPATNFTNWQDFVVDDDPVRNEYGLYYRRQITVHKPDYLPPTITRNL